MHGSIERRLDALEGRRAQPLRWVFQREDETEDEARLREGIGPDERIIVYSSLDAEL